MFTLTFPDNSKKEYDNPVTGEEIAKNISEGLLRNSVAIKYNDNIIDLKTPINKTGSVKIITLNDTEAIEILKH